jgi:hypothetical protein
LAKDTSITITDASVKMVQDITCGDELMGGDGTPRTVPSVASGTETLYQVGYLNVSRGFKCNRAYVLCLRERSNPETLIQRSVSNLLQHAGTPRNPLGVPR